MADLGFFHAIGPPLAESTADPDPAVAEAARQALERAAKEPAHLRREEEASHRWLVELADRASERGELEPEEFPPLAAGLACFLAFHTEQRGRPAGGWQASEVERFFRGDFPLECGLDDEALDGLPRSVRTWFRFLEETGRVDPAARPGIEEAIAAGEAAFAEAAREAGRFGIGTRGVMEMRRSGLDPADEGARRRWEEAVEPSILEILPAPPDPDLDRRRDRERAKREKLHRKQAERARRRNRGR